MHARVHVMMMGTKLILLSPVARGRASRAGRSAADPIRGGRVGRNTVDHVRWGQAGRDWLLRLPRVYDSACGFSGPIVRDLGLSLFGDLIMLCGIADIYRRQGPKPPYWSLNFGQPHLFQKILLLTEKPAKTDHNDVQKPAKTDHNDVQTSRILIDKEYDIACLETRYSFHFKDTLLVII